MANKVTKKVILEAVIKAVDNGVTFEGVDAQEVKAYAEKTIAQMNDKNEKAKVRAKAKRAEGDALYDAVKDAVTAEFATIGEITDKVAEAFPDVTKAKVTARLTKAVKAGEIYKAQAKTEDGKKVMVYGTEPVAEEDAE